MSRQRSRAVLQAHATRSATGLALLLHARDRGPREMGKSMNALLGSLLLAILLVVAVVVAGRIGAVIGEH